MAIDTFNQDEEIADFAVRHYSGVLVLTRPENLTNCAARVDSLIGAEVHHRDQDKGRLIAVLESPDADGQQQLLDQIREMPDVLSASLAYHFVDDPLSKSIGAGENP